MDKNKNGIFISFEGCDGTGKTSTLVELKKYLSTLSDKEKRNYKIVFTREPGGTNLEIAELIRSVLFYPKKKEKLEPWTEACLFAAARAEHVSKLILPALQEKTIVITDRYVDSSYVYQGLNLNLGYEIIKKINAISTQGLLPDLTFYFEVSDIVAKQRLENKKINENNNFNFLDEKEMENSSQTKINYKKIFNLEAQNFNRKIIFIDGNEKYENNIQKIWQEILKLCK